MSENEKTTSPIGIHIGHTENTQTKDQVLAILKAGYDYHLDQDTIRIALEAYKSASSISHISIPNPFISINEPGISKQAPPNKTSIL